MNLLRSFLCTKWTSNVGKDLEQYCADSITKCTKTSGNTLSVWFSSTTNFDSEEVRSLIVAFASSMERPDAVDFIWLDQQQLVQQGLTLESTDGITKYERIKDRHRDIAALDYQQLGIVGEHIVNQMKTASNFKRITKVKLVEMVVDVSITDTTFQLSSLKGGWDKHIQKELAKRESM
ncbi:hypothetical protein [Vibrio sp. OPT10]|uniref:hypothetical protein n=1 Tax=Vibrio sp. OPT10 TaxID=2778640 RepID=UPI00188172E2|nr:hypothetical protein [Vibrio sp. OPT10]MBE8607926.1 hypothetical protein [Vibrio sp. OPT10]